MSRVFLSHSSRDSRQAVAVKQWLIEQEPGLVDEIYLDLDPHTGIRPGARWKQALQQANARCEAVICLLSAHWLNSRECEVEFRYAENLHKAILCARLEPVPDTNITSEWQRCDLFPNHRPTTEVDIADGGDPVVLDSVGLQQLLDGLHTLGIAAEHFPWPPPADPGRAPYRGWAPLEEVDAAVFFGRDAQILRGVDVLHGMRSTGVESLFVILGPSGAGKSSFLRAGLLPRLRRDDRRFLPLPIVRPERSVLTGELGLAQAIHQLRSDLGLRQPVLGEVKNACHREDVERLRGWLEEARAAARARLLDVPADQPAPTLVLPVDQAEELFNADAGHEAPRFLELLGALAAKPGVTPGLIVALTIRADRYEPLQLAPALAGLCSVVFDDLKPMASTAYKEAITGPAQRATAAGQRLTVEPALVERLLADSAEGADALPLLALTLERLYRDFGGDGDMTLAEYKSMGGMTEVVQNEVDNLLAREPDARQAHLDILHDAFIPWLATINPVNNQPMRRLARWDDLPAASRPLIQAMVDRRLLVKDTRDGQTVVEVALESLLRQWKELVAWLRDEAQDLKAADALERAAADWSERRQDDAWLLSGTRLTEAEALAMKPRFCERLEPTRDFLCASRRGEDDRNSVKTKADRQSRELVSNRLVSNAKEILSGIRPGGTVRAYQQLIAARTFARHDGPLLDALLDAVGLIKVVEAESSVTSVAFSGDGTRLAAAGYELSVRVWDALTGQPIGQPLTGHIDGVSSVAFSPDGTRLATGSDDGTVRLWDTVTGQPTGAPLVGHTGTVFGVVFSPDGTRLASSSADGTVRVWETVTGQQIGQPLTGHTGWVTSVAFSGDGTRLASGSHDQMVRLWDAVSGRPIGQPLTGHTGSVTSVAFSPDATRLATGSDDRTVRIWEAATGQPIGQPLTGHTDKVNSIAYSPDGTRLATGSDDKTVRLWPAYPDPLAAVCAKLTTNMSHQQWRDWVSPDIDYIKVCPDLPVPPY